MHDRIAPIFADTLGIPAESVGPDTTMAATPRWTSLMHLNLCLSLEAEFGVEFSPEDMAEATSYDAIVAVLVRLGAK